MSEVGWGPAVGSSEPPRLGIGAVSREAIDAVIEVAREDHVRLMLIASRNQVEAAALGAGYVSGLTTESLPGYVRSRADGAVLLCRDHGGPFLADADRALPAEEAEARALASVAADLEAAFDLIHLDWSRTAGDRLGAARRALEFAVDRAQHPVVFEVGTDEADAGADTPEFVRQAVARFSDVTSVVEFFVARTGSLVRERFQVGFLEAAYIRRVSEIVHDAGMRLKEHNADYLDDHEIHARVQVEVDAVNVSPELGVAQTVTVAQAAMNHGSLDALEAFFRRADESRKWEKWQYASRMSPRMRAIVCGHYNFGSQEYQDLVGRLAERCDINAWIRDRLTSVIRRYTTAFARAASEHPGAAAPSKLAATRPGRHGRYRGAPDVFPMS
jgi:hypothetical protein